MARGDHPLRVPVSGAALSVVAFLACWAASLITVTWVAATIYAIAAVAAGIGFVMSFATTVTPRATPERP
ncbi:C4-dicarboxylate transporter [Mycolicibacterium iranicum]|uniref:C4-dicarboxylate transporter n=1 Tax=Mycolicibacterium iranicum TaxID=912594 RepID=A0A839QAF6_MYCIR|nr:hypothetical protein [Mycolicibacterium iranicum]MBB2989551.1 C4-dicarboxylate transporter [Mycolicibacterium iranicum]